MSHTGCRDFNGAVPQSLWMTPQFSQLAAPLSSALTRSEPLTSDG